jgi:hypothetical protein
MTTLTSCVAADPFVADLGLIDDLLDPNFGGARRAEPSDGLEPSTPSYHRATRRKARARPGSRGHESRARRRNRQKTSNPSWTPVPALVFPQCSLVSGCAHPV